jgi:hypothetical protein
MIRGLITTPLLLAALGVGAIYYAYGEVDPCRVLALEEARRGKDSLGGLPMESGLESWHRLETSQQSSGECAGRLARSWWARIATGIEDALD